MTEADGEESGATIELPEKTYFKIGEVAKLLEVEPYVLRYWETEFEMLEPEKTKSGQRVYQRHDIELLVQIKTLLYEEMFTIAGACRQIERKRQGKSSYFDLEDQASQPTAAGTAVADDGELRDELEEARCQLAATETDLQDTRRELEEARAEASKLEQELEEARSEAESGPTADELEEVRDELEDRERQLQEARRQAQALREDNRELSRRLEAVNEELEEHREVGSDEVQQLRAEVAELEEELEETRREAARQRQKMERSRQRRDDRQQLLGSLRSEVETLASLAESGSRSVR